jgi:transposase
VYDLAREVVRVDSTSACGYWQVSEEGLFQLGHSKDHRPDLPQVKVMLSSLDPLGMPICTEVLSGERADDPLYVPAIRKVQQTLHKRGLLYIGDAKMAALETRAFTAHSGDFYLCPLPKTQVSEEELEVYLHPVWEEEQALTPIYRARAEGEPEKIAEGYQQIKSMTAKVGGASFTWVERHLVVRSLKLAESAQKKLDKRIAKAQAQLLALNERKQGKKRYHSKEEMQPRVEEILEESQVQDLLEVAYHQSGSRRRLRTYKEKPDRVADEREVNVHVSLNEALYQHTIQRLGWRVYASNAPQEYLPLHKAVLAYRNEFILERGFGRLKGKPLSLRPMYLQCEEHILGLIRLLSLALRVLTLIEYQVRRQLAKQKSALTGLYKGNPKRATTKPTTEQMLKAFQEITLSIIQHHQQTTYHVTPLSQIQSRILELLSLSSNIYTKLAAQFQKPG